MSINMNIDFGIISLLSFLSMKLTNVVVQGKLDAEIPLRQLARDLINIRYDPANFSALIWQHRKVGGGVIAWCLLMVSSIVMGLASPSVKAYTD